MAKLLNSKKGMALISVYMVIVVLLIFMVTHMARSFNEFRFAMRQKDTARAYYIAEAGINEVTMGVYQAFLNSPEWTGQRSPIAFQVWFSPGGGFYNYALPQNIAVDGGRYTYSVVLPAANPVIFTADGVLVRYIGIGEADSAGGRVRKAIAATVAYEMGPSPVFNHAYFINNFGWLYGGGITANGDVRSNGNFECQGNPTVNGDMYATTNPELEAAGTITGNSRHDDIPHYINQAPARARSTNPTDPAQPQTTVLDSGYNGTSGRFEHQAVLNMPYLGDLSTYRELARTRNGRITQGGHVLVDNVYSGNGPDGIAGTPDDRSIVLIGTEADPVNISGPVVVEGDVVIRGVVNGQGTIYAGRNIHVVGNLTYASPPSWPKPDPTPTLTAQTNSARDFVGLACKGNVVIGDYTRQDWKTACERYLKTPFTRAYDTDATDAPLGYDSDRNPLNGYRFDGNYTRNDGGAKDNGRGGSTERKFYESSLADAYIKAISTPSNQIRNIDAIVYNNHAFTGRVGSYTLNGSIVCRDEAIIYSGSIFMNYDIRAHSGGIGNIDIYLPRDLVPPRIRTRQSG